MTAEGADSSREARKVRSSAKGWSKRFRKRALEDFPWYLPVAPGQLVDFLQSVSLPEGAALDVGCGPGVALAYLAKQPFRFAVGFDIAPSAIALARTKAQQEGVRPELAVAMAPYFPFRERSFSFIFDRGCLHVLKEADWPAYLAEVQRLLVPGGWLQLMEIEQRIDRAILSSSVPDTLQLIERDEFELELNGRRGTMLNWLLRKS